MLTKMLAVVSRAASCKAAAIFRGGPLAAIAPQAPLDS